MDKRSAMDEAVARVSSGSTLAIGGVLLYRKPVKFIRELLRHYYQTGQPNDITLLSFTAGIECDWLVGAGMVSRIRTCYFGLEIFGLAPMFTYYANNGLIEIIEETAASLAYGLRAQMASVGFMPGRGWIGTDLPALRPDIKSINDPYSGEELLAFPAIKPDVAVIHALRADKEGNVQIGANKGVDEDLAVAANFVIATAEEVDEALNKADIVCPFIDKVIAVPGGAQPTSCHPLYPLDGKFILNYVEQVTTPESFTAFIGEYLNSNP